MIDEKSGEESHHAGTPDEPGTHKEGSVQEDERHKDQQALDDHQQNGVLMGGPSGEEDCGHDEADLVTLKRGEVEEQPEYRRGGDPGKAPGSLCCCQSGSLNPLFEGLP